MEPRGRSSHGLVGAALLVGVALGFALFHRSEPSYGFVLGATPIRVADFQNGSTRGTLRVYNVRQDWRDVLGLVQRETGRSISKEGTFHGLQAQTVVVPQEESGRASLFDIPVREITVVKGRFVRDKSGTEVAVADDNHWSGVRVLEYRMPRLLDEATDWLRDKIRT
ncbi:hypothetical protein [Fimbriimonas ginsengisoli]|uniref:hypothetical protein n=1 Tax=Fimbriimonas ginsengisoli TaxID=1005039 RepID=UPI0011847CC7|nr:hypothetical protein [Fimbriimonas ginsengisoli]